MAHRKRRFGFDKNFHKDVKSANTRQYFDKHHDYNRSQGQLDLKRKDSSGEVDLKNRGKGTGMVSDMPKYKKGGRSPGSVDRIK